MLKKDKAGKSKDKEQDQKDTDRGNGKQSVRFCVSYSDITFGFNSLIRIFRSAIPHFGRMKELRTLFGMIKSIPVALKAVVKDGCDRCPAFTKLIQMGNVPGGCVIAHQAE